MLSYHPVDRARFLHQTLNDFPYFLQTRNICCYLELSSINSDAHGLDTPHCLKMGDESVLEKSQSAAADEHSEEEQPSSLPNDGDKGEKAHAPRVAIKRIKTGCRSEYAVMEAQGFLFKWLYY